MGVETRDGAAGPAGARLLRGLAALALAGTLAACAATYRNHGYVPDDRQLAALAVGGDTRESVEAAIGRPAANGVERAEGWYYVQSRVREYGPLPPRTTNRELVAISFAGNGTVDNIERFGLERGRVVTLSQRVTRTSIRDFGLIQQLIRNFGRINVGQTLSDGI